MSDLDATGVTIVGGGIGGASRGGMLARAGLCVLILEHETAFADRVRGEWIARQSTRR